MCNENLAVNSEFSCVFRKYKHQHTITHVLVPMHPGCEAALTLPRATRAGPNAYGKKIREFIRNFLVEYVDVDFMIFHNFCASSIIM